MDRILGKFQTDRCCALGSNIGFFRGCPQRLTRASRVTWWLEYTEGTTLKQRLISWLIRQTQILQRLPKSLLVITLIRDGFRAK